MYNICKCTHMNVQAEKEREGGEEGERIQNSGIWKFTAAIATLDGGGIKRSYSR